jgi:hypothetical protein
MRIDQRIGVRARATSIAIASALALAAAFGEHRAAAQQTACSKATPPPEGWGRDDCVEACELPKDVDLQPSEAFVAKLRSIGATGHHIDSVFGAALVRRRYEFRNFYSSKLSPDGGRPWWQNGRWVGPCTGLVAYFYSKAVEDSDPKNVVELYELRYASEVDAARVATLLTTSWAWAYHPYDTMLFGKSAILVEGRHRAWSAYTRVLKHLRAPKRR